MGFADLPRTFVCFMEAAAISLLLLGGTQVSEDRRSKNPVEIGASRTDRSDQDDVLSPRAGRSQPVESVKSPYRELLVEHPPAARRVQ